MVIKPVRENFNLWNLKLWLDENSGKAPERALKRGPERQTLTGRDCKEDVGSTGGCDKRTQSVVGT
jgi:hypothetical protein